MVSRIVNLLNREFKNINQAAITLGIFTLASQILALVRDRAFAHVLGPSASLDVYYAAFKIPDFLFVSVASLASITVLLPFLVNKIGLRPDGELNGGSDSARKFMNDVFTVFMMVMVGVAALVFIFMPELSKLVAPGFSSAEHGELVRMSRIMLLSPILLGVSNLLGTVTQMFKKFFVFALSPLFYNLGIIIGVVVLYPWFGIEGLALGVVAGAALHLLIQIPAIMKERFVPRISCSINWAEVRSVAVLSLPRTFGLAAWSLSIVVIVALASRIGEGAISIFQFALNFQNVPLGIIGVSYSVAAFPTLARYFSADNMKEFVDHVIMVARQIVFWSMPIMFLFIVLRAQIVRVILGSGAFSWEDTRLTAAALALFSISIVGQSLVLLLTRGFYAAGKTAKPLLINVFSAGLTVGLAFLFVHIFNANESIRLFFESLLRIEDIRHTELIMLPLAYSVGAIMNILLLWRSFRRTFPIDRPFLVRSVFESFAGAFFMGYVAYVCLDIFDNIFNITTFWGIFGQGLVSGVLGIAAGVAVLLLLKNQELRNLWESLRSKNLFKAENIVSSGQDEVQG